MTLRARRRVKAITEGVERREAPFELPLQLSKGRQFVVRHVGLLGNRQGPNAGEAVASMKCEGVCDRLLWQMWADTIVSNQA